MQLNQYMTDVSQMAISVNSHYL